MTLLEEALERLGQGASLSVDQAYAAVGTIMDGQATELEIGALLTALRVKGETVDELLGGVRAVRDRTTGWIAPPGCPALLDTCGTGGDGACTANLSTAAAVVVAACGVRVAKHGNRSASGNSGSAEVLSELGVAVDAQPALAARCLAELGITFLFAPRYHPAMRFAAPVRRRLPFRTLFNLVGPLANPARPEFQLLGVASEAQAELVASALAKLETGRAAVVTGRDGLDEVTLGGPTHVRWVERGRAARDEIWEAASFGLPRVERGALKVSGPAESAARLRALFRGEPGAIRDVVLANAAAALLVVERVETLREGVLLAARALDSGAAAQLVERWGPMSRGEGA
jgi:anthranilate phosphoribosyltransferase